jgi:NADH-quinone oxidoreductase subunit N
VIDPGAMTGDLALIMPLLAMWGLASIVLLLLAFARNVDRRAAPGVACLGLLYAAWQIISDRGVYGVGASQSAFAGAVRVDDLANVSNVALIVTALLSILLGYTYLRNRGLEHAEYYVLVLLSTSGAMLMAMAQDLIVLFLGLEILSFALYVLAGFARTDEKSEEASLKYFLLGAFASAFLLYGIALVYGATQSTNLETISRALMNQGSAGSSTMMLVGVALLIVGLGFKAGVIPFHQWTPDVYEGAPTSATAFMAGAAKIGAFAALLRVFEALVPIHGEWLPAMRVIAVLTMVVGNILAVTQTNVKRMLAYSSIAHAGYLLVAVAALGHSAGNVGRVHDLAMGGALFYLFAYVFMTLGAFGVLIYLTGAGKDYQYLEDLKGLARTKPLAAYAMLFFMLSLGGIPPTMGFMGKWQIFIAAVSGGEITLAVILGLSSVIAAYYYLRIVWVMMFEEPAREAPEAPVARSGAAISLVLAAAATVVFGFLPGLLSSLLNGIVGAK